MVAPLALTQALDATLVDGATIVNITSDAAVEAYEGWGGYGSSKAAFEQPAGVLAAEQPELRVLVVDPGDMRTEMHQDAFPGEDISDRPGPVRSCPGCRPDQRRPAERALRGTELVVARNRGSHDRDHRTTTRLDFVLDPAHEAHEPAGGRGAAATTCGCSVSPGDAEPVDATLRRPRPRSSRRGDLLVVNTSATIPAAIDGRCPTASRSSSTSPTELPGGVWLVEVRRPRDGTHRPAALDDLAGVDVELLAGGGHVAPARAVRRLAAAVARDARRSRATGPRLPRRHGRPIRYRHVPRDWPLERVPADLRHGAGQRRDAERVPAVHRRGRRRPRRARRH